MATRKRPTGTALTPDPKKDAALQETLDRLTMKIPGLARKILRIGLASATPALPWYWPCPSEREV